MNNTHIFLWCFLSLCLIFSLKGSDDSPGFSSGEIKSRLQRVNSELVDIDFILYAEYRLQLHTLANTLIYALDKPIVLGFCGFKPSAIRGNTQLSSYVEDSGDLIISKILSEIVKTNLYSLNGSDLENLKIGILSAQKSSEIAGRVVQNPGIYSSGLPVIIVWDMKNEPELPGSMNENITVFSFSELVGKTMNDPLLSRPVLQKSQTEQKINTVHTEIQGNPPASPPPSTFSPPAISPLVLPQVKKYVFAYLKNHGTFFKALNPDSLTYTISPLNKELVIHGIYDEKVVHGYRIALPHHQLPISVIQDSMNRRGNSDDPEFIMLTRDILNNTELYTSGQQVFTNTSAYLSVPDVFWPLYNLVAIASGDQFAITDCRIKRNEKGTPEKIELIVSCLKSSLPLTVFDEITDLQVSHYTVTIDFIKKSEIFKGQMGLDNCLVKDLFKHPLIKYRLTLYHPAYDTTVVGDFITADDFLTGKKYRLRPRPAFNFFYIDGTCINTRFNKILEKIFHSVFLSNQKFLLFISGSDPPLLSSRKEDIENTLNKALYMRFSAPQADVDKNRILNEIPLDSIPSDWLIKLNFIYNTENIDLSRGSLAETMQNELSSGLFNRNTSVTIWVNGDIQFPWIKKNFQVVDYSGIHVN